MTDIKDLNPDNLEDIKAVLTKSKDEQLYFFLDDSFPHDDKIPLIFIKETKNPPTQGVLSDFHEATCMIADALYEMKEPEIKKYIENVLPFSYIPLLKHCYHAYTWEISVNNLTAQQIAKLTQIRQQPGCMALQPNKIPANIDYVPATITLTIGSIKKTVPVNIYDPCELSAC